VEKETVRVCFCTPEPDFGGLVSRALGEGFDVILGDCDNAAALPGEEGFDCVLLDLHDLPAGAELETGLRQLARFRRTDSSPPVVVMLDDGDPALLRRLVEAGAYDVLEAPPNIVELRWVLRRAHRLHRVEKELRELREEVARLRESKG